MALGGEGLGKLVVGIETNANAMAKGLRQAESKTKTFAKKAGTLIQEIKKHWLAYAVAITASILALKKLINVTVNFTKKVIEAASTTEQLKLRLTALLGSVKEGNRLFNLMADYAGRVAFEYEEIMEAATTLAGVVEGGADEVARWIPLIGDLAAATGLSFEIVTSQIVRMYSAGAASADMFRERGILAMLGFQAGVKYTTEETRRMLFEAWEKEGSMFRGLAKDLGSTWKGIMSMFADRWFEFRNKVAEAGIFDVLKIDLQAILGIIDKSKEEGGKYEEVVRKVGKALNDAYENLKKLIFAGIIGIGGVIDTLIGFNIEVKAINVGLLKMIDFMNKLSLFNVFPRFRQEARFLWLELKIAERELREAMAAASVSWKQRAEEMIATINTMMETIKTDIIAKNAEIAENVTNAANNIKKKVEKKAKETGDAWEGVSKRLQSVWSSAIFNMTKGTETFKGFWQATLDVMKRYFIEIFVKAILDAFMKMIAKMAVIKTIFKFIGLSFEEGGILTKAGTKKSLPSAQSGALIEGEGAVPVLIHPPEFIFPPERLYDLIKGAMAIGAKMSSVTAPEKGIGDINITVNNYGDFKTEADIDEITSEIGQKVKDAIKSS